MVVQDDSYLNNEASNSGSGCLLLFCLTSQSDRRRGWGMFTPAGPSLIDDVRKCLVYNKKDDSANR